MTVEVSRLDNGLTVATDAMVGVHSATVGVWVDAGARDESAELNGISHLLEHMAFKGTARRSALDISREIEAVGGHLNAYTSREHTAYHARVLSPDLPLAVDLLADILRNSTFEAAELEREIKVVAQEIAQVDDTPDDLIFDLFQETAYPDQPMGRSILGTAEGIARIGRDTLRGHLDRAYQPDRMMLVAAGAVEHGAVMALAKRAFGTMARSANGHERNAPAYRGGERREERELEQLHVVLGFAGAAYGDALYYPLQVFSTLLGGGMSSRLFQEVREKRGLAYAIHSFAASYVDGGLFGIYAGCDAASANEVLDLVCAEARASAAALTAEEVERAKAQLRAGLLMALESSSARAEQLARHLLVFGRPVPVETIIERVDAVTVADVVGAARAVLRGDRLTMTAIGPIEGLPARDALAGRLP